jgi:hypothetical protein
MRKQTPGANTPKAAALVLIASVALALALAGCASDDDAATTAASTSTTEPAAVEELPVSEATLPAGSYETTVFKPSLTVRIPDDPETWRTLGPGQSKNHVALGVIEAEPLQQVRFGLHVMDAVADPKKGARTEAEAVDAPADFIDWLADHPHLRAEKPVEIRIGGARGRQIDVTPVSVPSRVPKECVDREIECVPLFFDGGDDPPVYPVGTRIRFIGLDVGNEQVVVEQFSDPGDQFDRVIDLFDPALQSITFTGQG